VAAYKLTHICGSQLEAIDWRPGHPSQQHDSQQLFQYVPMNLSEAILDFFFGCFGKRARKSV